MWDILGMFNQHADTCVMDRVRKGLFNRYLYWYVKLISTFLRNKFKQTGIIETGEDYPEGNVYHLQVGLKGENGRYAFD